MAEQFGFAKPEDPQFAGLEDGGIIDIQTSVLTYQMVPMGGRRMVTVFGPPGVACRVAVNPPRNAVLAARTFQPLSGSGVVNVPPGADQFSQSLPADVRMRFDIQPLAPGHTDIELRGAGGAPIASMKVAVKAETIVTVSACRLADIEFQNKFDEATIRSAMARAKIVYKNTANVTLLDDPTIYPVECDIGLGNPIVLGRAVTEFNTETSTVHAHIVRKTPAAAKAASVVAIFGWDFELTHLPIVGLQSGRFCFVEFDAVAHNRNMTLEHEIGHALGLGHTKVRSIMNGDGFNGLERFEADEIEILNKTGIP